MSRAAAAVTRRRRRRLPDLGVWPSIVAVVLILGLIGAMAIEPTRQLFEQRQRVAGMAGELERIQGLNDQLVARIDRLKDPDFIEQRAREQSGLVRPGETTWIVMPPGKKARKKAEKAEKAPPKVAPARAGAEVARPEAEGALGGFLRFVGFD